MKDNNNNYLVDELTFDIKLAQLYFCSSMLLPETVLYFTAETFELSLTSYTNVRFLVSTIDLIILIICKKNNGTLKSLIYVKYIQNQRYLDNVDHFYYNYVSNTKL